MVDVVKKDPNDPTQRLSRAEAMEVVMANRKVNLAKDMSDDAPAAIPPVEAAPAPAPGDVDLGAGGQLAAQIEPVVLNDADLSKYLVRTKVYGKEQLVPLGEVRDKAQMAGAADVLLAEAKEQARIILEKANAAAATPAAPAAAAAPAAGATGAVSDKPADTGALIAQAVESLFKGDEDGTRRLLTEAITAVQQAKTTPALALNVDELSAAVEQKVAVRSALRQFAKDYPAIVGDPRARGVADQFLTELTEGKPLEAFPESRVTEILADTGKRVVAWTRGLAGVPADGQPANTRLDKEERKEGIDELPAASVRASTNVPQPKTTSDVIASMRAARGQGPPPT